MDNIHLKWGLDVQQPGMNGFQLGDPNIGIFVLVSQFAVLKLGL